MLPLLIKCTSSATSAEPIWINPLNVTHVYGGKAETIIFMNSGQKDNAVGVRETPDQINKLIKDINK